MTQLKEKLTAFSILVLKFLTLPAAVSAQTQTINIDAVVTRIRQWVIWPVFLGLVVIMIIYAGILFVTSAGDPSRITKARTAILWALVGVFVGLLAYSAVGFIKFIIGIN